MSTSKPNLSAIAGASVVVITMAFASNVWAQPKAAPASVSAYYTSATTPIFNPFPNVTDKKSWLVRNLGPVGIGTNLVGPGMTMEINNVEKGSPAEATGKLKKGQIIESINGKTSGLAYGLGAAAMIPPDGEASVFAKARDNSAMKGFYATNWFHAAHTGGGMGEIWHHTAVNQMREKRPVSYRSYFDTRRWVMDLSRRFDGGIGIAGMDDRYDQSASENIMAWGTYFALTYTLPRKHLQLFGAHLEASGLSPHPCRGHGAMPRMTCFIRSIPYRVVRSPWRI